MERRNLGGPQGLASEGNRGCSFIVPEGRQKRWVRCRWVYRNSEGGLMASIFSKRTKSPAENEEPKEWQLCVRGKDGPLQGPEHGDQSSRDAEVWGYIMHPPTAQELKPVSPASHQVYPLPFSSNVLAFILCEGNCATHLILYLLFSLYRVAEAFSCAFMNSWQTSLLILRNNAQSGCSTGRINLFPLYRTLKLFPGDDCCRAKRGSVWSGGERRRQAARQSWDVQPSGI